MASLVSLPNTRNSISFSSHFKSSIIIKHSHAFDKKVKLCFSQNPTKLTSSCAYAPSNNSSSCTRTYRRQGVKTHRQSTKIRPNPRQFNNENRKEKQPSLENPTFQSINVDLMKLCNEGKVKEALDSMGQGVLADYNVFNAFLDACRDMNSLELSRRVNEFLRRSEFAADSELNNKLIHVYEVCASMRDARRMFDKMRERNMASLNLIINGYAVNGKGDDGLLLFEEMRKDGFQPDSETFLAVL